MLAWDESSRELMSTAVTEDVVRALFVCSEESLVVHIGCRLLYNLCYRWVLVFNFLSALFILKVFALAEVFMSKTPFLLYNYLYFSSVMGYLYSFLQFYRTKILVSCYYMYFILINFISSSFLCILISLCFLFDVDASQATIMYYSARQSISVSRYYCTIIRVIQM